MAHFTAKQRLFIEHYLETLNATEAARRAGYKGNDNVLAGIGHENLRKPKIRDQIDRRLAEAAMGANEVLHRLTMDAKASISELITVRKDGTWSWDMQKIKAYGHLIKSIRETRHGLSITLVDSQKAKELLGKHHKLFTERIEHDAPEDLKRNVEDFHKLLKNLYDD